MHPFVHPRMARILFIACMLVTWGCGIVTALETPSSSPSASSSGNWSQVIYTMSECLGFLINGSNYTKPGSACCSGFESVVRTNVDCICESVRSGRNLGFDLNVTRAFALSSLCGISSPPLTTCGVTPPSQSPPPVTPPSQSPPPVTPPSPSPPPVTPPSPSPPPVTPPSPSPPPVTPPSPSPPPVTPPSSPKKPPTASPSPSKSPPPAAAPASSPHSNNGAACSTAAQSITVVIISMLVVASFSIISV